MEEPKQKRERGRNYSDAERELLVEIVSRHSKIVECKKTDGVPKTVKDKEWNLVTAEFQAATPRKDCKRKVASLRKTYTDLKQGVRRHRAAKRLDVFATGGGPATVPDLTQTQEKVLAIILPQTEPIANPFDGDAEFIALVDQGKYTKNES